MTQTADLIRRMEAAKTPAEQRIVQSGAPTDSVFRDVLALLYDPYEQHGTPIELRTHEPLSNVVAIDAYLAEMWPTFAAAARSGVGYDTLRQAWEFTPGWPVFYRVLRKHLTGVSAESVNSVWGTIPLFDAGEIGDGGPIWPCIAVPFVRVARRILVCRPNTVGRVRCDLFDVRGACLTETAEPLVDALRECDWSRVLTDQLVEGLVFDGFVRRDTFISFDLVPLPVFREQAFTVPYTDRARDLNRVVSLIDNRGVLQVALTVRLETMTPHAAVQLGDLRDLSENRSVFGIDPGAPYPYSASHAWRWLIRDGNLQ